MFNARVRPVLAMLALAVLAGCAAQSDRQVLRKIVHDRCVPSQISQGKPNPCVSVSLAAGIAQYLVVPTKLITGIEDPKPASPYTPNYFTPAWQARPLVEERLGKTLARGDVAIAVSEEHRFRRSGSFSDAGIAAADLRNLLRAELRALPA